MGWDEHACHKLPGSCTVYQTREPRWLETILNLQAPGEQVTHTDLGAGHKLDIVVGSEVADHERTLPVFKPRATAARRTHPLTHG